MSNDINIANSTFLNNKAKTSGIQIAFSTGNIENTTFELNNYGNQTQAQFGSGSLLNGGFIYASVSVSLYLKNCSFKGGIARTGGAIYASGETLIHLLNTDFKQNYCERQGGDLYLTNYNYTLVSE